MSRGFPTGRPQYSTEFGDSWLSGRASTVPASFGRWEEMFHVKPDLHSTLDREAITATLTSYGVSASEEQVATLLAHAEMVLEANERLNLTRIVEPSPVLELHIADSALALDAVASCPGGPLFDIGSGAGYPGVVLGVLSRRHLLMVESVKKKAAFLESVCNELALDAQVFAERVEALGPPHAGTAAVVTARAVSALPALVELSAPLLMQGGRLIALKARIDQTELSAGRSAAGICGMKERDIVKLRLGSEHHRTLVVYERVSGPRIALPRRPGLAQRSPFGM